MVRIPSEYQEVEYLESTRTQYIKTDVLPSQDLSFHCKFLVTSSASPGYGNVFGSRGNSGVREYQLSAYNFGTVSVGTRNASLGFSPNEINIVDFDGNNTVNINGVSKIINTGEDYNDYPIVLFGIVQDTSVMQLQAGKIYELSFGSVANFIPCYRKSDSKPGMYDTVSGTFYVNSGTGEFLVGNNVYYDTTNLLESRRRILLTTPHLESPTPANPLTFKSNMTTKLKEGKVYFTPVQEGTGDPSPDNVRPILGWDSITVTKCGKNLFSGEQIWKLCTPDASINEDENGRYVNPGSAVDFINFPNGIFKEKTQYTFIMKTYASAAIVFYVVLYSDGVTRNITAPVGLATFAIVTAAGKTVKGIRPMSRSGTRRFYYEESGVFEGNLTTDAYEPYTETKITISFPKTIYGGYVDLVNGEVVEEWEGYSFTSLDQFTQVNISASKQYANMIINEGKTYFSATPNNGDGNIIFNLGQGRRNAVNAAYVETNKKQFSILEGATIFPEDDFTTTEGVSTWLQKMVQNHGSLQVAVRLAEESCGHYSLTDGLTHLTLGESIAGLPNGRSSTGGYANSTVSGGADGCKFIYFELGWPTETYLQYSADYSRLNEFKLDGYTLRSDITSWGTASAGSMTLGEFAITEGSSTDSEGDPLVYAYISLPSDYTDLDAKRAYLAEHPLNFTYPKKTPISYTIDQDNLRPVSGANNLWSDANGNVEVKFWKH